MAHSTFFKFKPVLFITLLFFLSLDNNAYAIPISKHTPERNPIYGNFFEGDMRFPVGQDPRNGLVGERYRWPNGTVPYTISTRFDHNEKQTIIGALDEISNKTCVRFVERVADEDYVFIERGEANSGCWSYVGLQGGRQVLNLQPPPGPHCIWHGTIAHEIMHAIALYHEQSRTDRDDYVTIVWDNIPHQLKSNFDKYDRSVIDDHGIPYDYGSLMHYNAYAFAIDPRKPTIVPKINVQVGQNEGLSQGDVNKVRRMYKC